MTNSSTPSAHTVQVNICIHQARSVCAMEGNAGWSGYQAQHVSRFVKQARPIHSREAAREPREVTRVEIDRRIGYILICVIASVRIIRLPSLAARSKWTRAMIPDFCPQWKDISR